MPQLFIVFLLHWASPEPIRFLPPVDVQSRITQPYSRRHHGVDIAVPRNTLVTNAGLGMVVVAAQSARSQSGRHVVVSGLGPFAGYEWSYCHLSSIRVAVGQVVDAGEVIGLSGNTGLSTGPHLHYAVLHNGHWIKPPW